MKPCPNCKQELPEKTLFCPHCGFRVNVPPVEGKLLTGSHGGDVFVGILLHVGLLFGLNALVHAIDRYATDWALFYTPLFSVVLYLVVSLRLKYHSLGKGIWWTYLIGLIALVALFVLCFGMCLIGGMGWR
jgi:hypothetical protein